MPVSSRRRDAFKDSQWFIDELKAVSPGALRALWLPAPPDTTTNLLKPDGRTWTNSATIQGRITPQGNGILVSFNGTDQYVSTGDTDDLSPLTGAFSGVVLANVANTAGTRPLINKRGAGGLEYAFMFDASDALSLYLYDNSATAIANRTSNAAGTMGALALHGFSCTPGTDTAAANNTALYVNGAAIASTAGGGTSFVAMENLAVPLNLGYDPTLATYMSTQMGFAALYAAALTAAQHARIASICREFYGVKL